MKHLLWKSSVTLLLAAAGSAFGQSQAAPYKVVDGYKVDANTMEGFRTWRAAACDAAVQAACKAVPLAREAAKVPINASPAP